MGERYVHATKVRSRRQPWLTTGALRPVLPTRRAPHSAGITHLRAGRPGLFPPVRRIGRTPHRDRFGSGSMTPGAIVCRRDGRAGRVARPQGRIIRLEHGGDLGRAGCAARPHGRRTALPGTASLETAELHIRVRSALTETLESCGNVDSVATRIPLPCAQTPLGAHGSPATECDYRRESA